MRCGELWQALSSRGLNTVIWIFERKETENKIIIVQKPYLYYLVFSAYIFYFAQSILLDFGILEVISDFLWSAFVLFVLINLKSIFVTRIELSRNMKAGHIVMSGSRLSIKKPVTYTIQK